MRPDPYIAAWWRQRVNRARAEGAVAAARAVLVPLVAAALLVPLVRPTFLAFLDGDPVRWGDGMRGVVLRWSMVAVGWLAIELFGALVRGHGREVLAILPVDPALVARAEIVRIAAERWWLLPCTGLVLSPVAIAGAPGLWAAGLAAIAACALLGLGGGALAHLLAIRVAESPAWAPILDLLRGHNPRPQAAFLYAPGAVLVASAALLVAASRAVPRIAAGDPTALPLLALPALAGVLCLAAVPGVAREAWFRGSAVLAEIDARYATLADPAEATRVYLDWAVRFLPAPLRLYALDDLRHGWRTRRSLVTGAWLAAALAAGAGWTADPSGPARVTAIVVAAAFVVAANGVLLARDEPPFLRAMLPRAPTPSAAARLLVLTAWALPPVALGATSVAIRRGAEAAEVLLVGLVATLAAGLLAVACGRFPDRGLAAYAPVGTLLAAALVALGPR